MVEEMTFRQMSPAEWFARNKAFAGFDNPTKAAFTQFREFVENGMDSCEQAHVRPDIFISVNEVTKKNNNNNKKTDPIYLLTVVDNGIGVPAQYVPEAFGKVFFGSKYEVKQHRGEFGMGAKMAFIYSLLEVGEPFTIATATENDTKINIFKMEIDLKTNEPKIHEQRTKERKANWHGVIVSLLTNANFSGSLSKIEGYLQLTSVICPYASIKFVFNNKVIFESKATSDILPEVPQAVKYHPQGIDLRILKSLIEELPRDVKLSRFLSSKFQRVGSSIAEDFIKQCDITDKNVKSLTNEEMQLIISMMREYKFLVPDTKALSPITESIFLTGVKNKFQPEFITYSMKRGVEAGHGAIVECVVAVGGEIPYESSLGRCPEPFRFANKIPLVYDKGACAMTAEVSQTDVRSYGIDDGTKCAVFLSICSTHVPYKTAGKEFISSDFPAVSKLLSNAYLDALRQIRMWSSQRKHRESEAKRRSIFDLYIPLIADNLSQGLVDEPKEKIQEVLFRSIGRNGEVENHENS